MLQKFNKDAKIREFWNWFTTHRGEFEDLGEHREEKLDLMLEKLGNIQTGLSIEISLETEGDRELVISAEGDMDKFPIVKEIVAQAPTIKGWQIIAFRQPATDDFTLAYEDIELTPSELYFAPIVEQDSLDIIVYGEGFDKYDYDELGHYGLIMLDTLMGEYNCVTKVRYYDFKDLQEAADRSNLRSLSEINTFIETFYLNKNWSGL